VAGLLAATLTLGGCFRKKKPPLPPQAQAPTVTPEAQPKAAPPPPASGEPNRPQPEATPAPETAAPPPKPVAKPRPKPKPQRNIAKKPAPEKPSRTVVEEGGTRPTGAQLSASLPHDAAIHQQFNTAQLLEATEYNLKSITRQLTTDEQAMVQHIRSYVQQSRDASKDGDVERAYNLALKAHLLSNELVKR